MDRDRRRRGGGKKEGENEIVREKVHSSFVTKQLLDNSILLITQTFKHSYSRSFAGQLAILIFMIDCSINLVSISL